MNKTYFVIEHCRICVCVVPESVYKLFLDGLDGYLKERKMVMPHNVRYKNFNDIPSNIINKNNFSSEFQKYIETI